MNVAPISGALGAEVTGVDLAQPLDDGAVAEIRAHLVAHLVLFFRDQRLTPETQCAFAARFGPLVRPANAGSLDGYPDVTLVERAADAPRAAANFGGTWHSDQSFREVPAAGFTLRAVDVPPYGGDTLFANDYLAYERLSPAMRTLADGLVAVHSHAVRGATAAGTTHADVEHPLVCVHPESKRRYLYLSGSWLRGLRGMTADESDGLLATLNAHATRPEFTCRFRWSPGTLALLDNRCTQHFAINDYAGHHRVMHRVMFGGTRPVASAN